MELRGSVQELGQVRLFSAMQAAFSHIFIYTATLAIFIHLYMILLSIKYFGHKCVAFICVEVTLIFWWTEWVVLSWRLMATFSQNVSPIITILFQMELRPYDCVRSCLGDPQVPSIDRHTCIYFDMSTYSM